jgi:hypothetical protein
MTQPAHPNDREARRRLASGAGLKATVDGVEYVVHVGEMSAVNRRLFRDQVGLAFSALASQPNLLDPVDLVAAVVWMARVIRGEKLVYMAVASEFGLEDTESVDIDFVGAPDTTPDPVRAAGDGEAGPEA